VLEDAWRAADEPERDFYQGGLDVAALLVCVEDARGRFPDLPPPVLEPA
jgi:hypothetical protein